LFGVWIGLALGIAMGCNTEGNPLEPAKMLLYVLDNGNKAIYVFEGVDTLDGPQDPAKTLSGDNTLLSNPTAIVVNGLKDVLFVSDANQDQVLVFRRASTLEGDVVPFQKFPAGTHPFRMSLDNVNDRLYVYNLDENTILVWDEASLRPDGTPPDRIWRIAFTASAIFIDQQRDLLYVGAPGENAVLVYSQASRSIGDRTPVATISDSETMLTRLDSLTENIDNDILYVVDSINPSVEIFDNASTLNGDIMPDRVLEGDQTDLNDKTRFILFLQDVLYLLLNDTQIGVYNNANQLTGNTAPNRLITVNPANRPVGFAIDLLH